MKKPIKAIDPHAHFDRLGLFNTTFPIRMTMSIAQRQLSKKVQLIVSQKRWVYPIECCMDEIWSRFSTGDLRTACAKQSRHLHPRLCILRPTPPGWLVDASLSQRDSDVQRMSLASELCRTTAAAATTPATPATAPVLRSGPADQAGQRGHPAGQLPSKGRGLFSYLIASTTYTLHHRQLSARLRLLLSSHPHTTDRSKLTNPQLRN